MPYLNHFGATPAERDATKRARNAKDHPASFHRRGDCECPRHRPSGRVCMGFSVCLACGLLLARKAS